MKKRFFYFLCCLLFTTKVTAQISLIRSEQLEIPFEVNYKEDTPNIKWTEEDILHQSTFKQLVEIDSFLFKSEDIALNLLLPKLEKGFYFSFDLSIKNENNTIRLTPENRLGNFSRVVDHRFSPQLIWKDPLTQEIPTNKQVYLNLNYQLYGENLDCETPPRFSLKFKHQWPQYSIGVLGVGLMGLSLPFKNKFQANKANYESSWNQSIELNQSPDVYFTKAQSQKKTYAVLINTGLSILVADALIFGYRLLVIHKKRKKRYENYCKALY